MEYEVRYYFPSEKINIIIDKLKNTNLVMHERSYEKTIQYDQPDEKNSFYNKEIDGRFRVRVTKDSKSSKCKLSWKRRIKSTLDTDINKEEEVELTIKYEEYDNFMFILNNVLKMKQVESYERYRTIFTNDDIEIAVDEYPFGIALEIECKSNKEPEQVIKEWVMLLGLNISDAYRLSWDDKYSELCNEQGIEKYNHVTFDKPMPQVKE